MASDLLNHFLHYLRLHADQHDIHIFDRPGIAGADRDIQLRAERLRPVFVCDGGAGKLRRE